MLRENPMQGAVRVSLEREPDAFVAAALEGRPHHTVVARDPSSGRLVGMGHRAVMDVYVLAPTPPGEPLPPAPPTHVVAEHEVWASSPGVATIGTVLDQDMPNVSGVQRGMKAGRTPFVRFGTYQESRIRHFHRTLDSYLGGA